MVCAFPQLADHFNAEILGGTIKSKQDGLDYLTWTYFFRRLVQNPSFYSLESTDDTSISSFLSDMVESTLNDLEKAGCVKTSEDGSVESLTMGRIAAFFYLKHETMSFFNSSLTPGLDFKALLQVIQLETEFTNLCRVVSSLRCSSPLLYGN